MASWTLDGPAKDDCVNVQLSDKLRTTLPELPVGLESAAHRPLWCSTTQPRRISQSQGQLQDSEMLLLIWEFPKIGAPNIVP